MAVWTSPSTAVATNQLPAATWNSDVRDNMLWLGTRKGFKIRRVANQSISSASTTAISFDTEDSDTDAFGAVTSTTYTIPTGLDGLYAITAQVTFASASLGAAPALAITAAGVAFWTAIPLSSVAGVGSLGITIPMVATQTISVSVYQNSGGAVNATATLWANFVGR